MKGNVSFFLKSGLTYSLFTLVYAGLNWFFWWIAVKLTNPSDIGLASSIFSLPILYSTIVLLSTEYPLLKTTSKEKSYFGSIFFFEIIIHIILIPILIISIQKITTDFYLILLSISIMFTFMLNTISNYALLGNFSVKSTVVIQSVSAIIKITLLILFLKSNMGSEGILLAILSQFLVSGIVLALLAHKSIGFKIKKESLKTILLEGISNFPSKLFLILQSNASIVILAFFGISYESIAAFTISYGFIQFISGVPASFSQIAIPSSTKANNDLSSTSGKIGMAIAVPLITILIVSPRLALGVYDPIYSKHHELLLIMTLSLIPFMLKTNIVTMLNNTNQLKKLTLLGIIESSIFLISIFILIPLIGDVGASWAITLGSIGSGILSLVWATKELRRIFFICLTSIIVACFSTLLLRLISSDVYLITLESFVVAIFFLFSLKLIRIADILSIMKQIRKI